MIYGLDVLAGARYQKRIIKGVPHGWAIGLFWDTFGDIKKLLHQLGKRGHWPVIRVQGIWKDDHNFRSSDEIRAIKIAEEYNAIAVKYPGIRWQYSPFCEHRLPPAVMRPLFQRLKNAAPNLELVNAPISGGDWVDNATNEIHHKDRPAGNPGKKFNFSFDGMHCVDADVEKWKEKYKDADVFFFWILQFNQKRNRTDKTPRDKRKCKPTIKDIRSIVYLSACKVVDSLSKQWQWKSHSEQHTDVDPRANKPVVLGPSKGKLTIKIGKKTKTLTYSGTEHGGDHVYRCLDKYGYQLAAQSLKRGGDGSVEVLFNGKSLGRIDPGYRSSKRYIE